MERKTCGIRSVLLRQQDCPMNDGPHVPGGCIVVARKMLDSDLMDQSPLVVKLWMWILLRAFWKDGDKLKRGQLITTISEMQEAMSHYSGWRKMSPTPDQIRSAYGTLRDTARITVRRTTRGMVISVINYNTYQDIKAYASHTASHDGTATGPAATPHDREEVKELNKPCAKKADRLADFDLFWNAFAYKKGKGGAEKSWLAIKNYSPDLLGKILEAAKKEATSRPAILAKGLTPKMAQGWLTERRWEDEQPTNANQADDMGFYR